MSIIKEEYLWTGVKIVHLTKLVTLKLRQAILVDIPPPHLMKGKTCDQALKEFKRIAEIGYLFGTRPGASLNENVRVLMALVIPPRHRIEYATQAEEVDNELH